MSKLIRAFVAIDIPEKIREEIIKIQKQIPEFNGKLTERENLHLTLKFLGEIDEEKIGKVRERLGEINFQKFEIKIDKIGFFKKEHGAIIWLHLTNCELLQKEIDKRLENLFEPEKKFMSHLTIARVKSVKDKKSFFNQVEKIKFSSLEFKVDEFNLKESVLTLKKPLYTNIGKYELN